MNSQVYFYYQDDQNKLQTSPNYYGHCQQNNQVHNVKYFVFYSYKIIFSIYFKQFISY